MIESAQRLVPGGLEWLDAVMSSSWGAHQEPRLQPRLLALLALAFVLYVIASVGARGAQLDGGTAVLSCVAITSALTPVWLRIRATAETTDTARRRVGMLGLVLAVALAARLSMQTRTLLGEIASGLALPAAGLVVLRLALDVPDRPRALARMRWPLALAVTCALIAALLGVAASLPPLWLDGRALIAPHALASAPAVALCGAAAIALGLRLARRALGSTAHALAANLWGAIGTGALLIFFALFAWLAHVGAPPAMVLGVLALAAGLCLGAHVCMVVPARIRSASASARRLLALTLALVISLLCTSLSLRLLEDSLWGHVGIALAVFAAADAGLHRMITRALAPGGGTLLAALDELALTAYGALDFEEFASRVLKPLRRAAGLPEAAPLLASFDPERIAQLDAAGCARIHSGSLARAIVQRLREAPGKPIVRSELAGSLTRRPDLVPLARALEELDALCVLPLRTSGELDGALVIVRGARRAPLTLEELLALESTSRALAPLVANFLSLARTRARADRAEAEQRELRLVVEQQVSDLADLRAPVNAVKAGLGLPLPAREPVRYSASMRGLLDRATSFAAHALPTLLWGEAGADFAAVARAVHHRTCGASQPLVILDGAAFDEAAAMVRLFGRGEGAKRHPGVLELIDRGTLLVLDFSALSASVQSALVEVLEERRVRPVDASSTQPFSGRIIVTARRELSELRAAAAVVPELARWLEASACRVPPLRERPEDFESLLLLALDRAARVLAKPPKGVDAEALRVLLGYDWPGNEAELESVIEAAFARARGARLTVADLVLAAPAAVHAKQGSFGEQQRAILRRALRQTGGNRSRAARALGLKRAAFEAVARELGLDRRDSAEN